MNTLSEPSSRPNSRQHIDHQEGPPFLVFKSGMKQITAQLRSIACRQNSREQKSKLKISGHGQKSVIPRISTMPNLRESRPLDKFTGNKGPRLSGACEHMGDNASESEPPISNSHGCSYSSPLISTSFESLGYLEYGETLKF